MTDDHRSLSSSISIPQWMKTRMNDRGLTLADIIRLNVEQTTFSPPENDDNFLYIRYNKIAAAADVRNAPNTANGQLEPKIEVVPKALSTAAISSTSIATTDFSKHTAPCKKFIPNSVNAVSGVTKQFPGKVKSNGTDDGFKGEAAQCGSSVIRVAHQMVSSKLTRGASIPEEEFSTEPAGFNRDIRRGSRSLPSSPLTSPNVSPRARRRQMNRYFASGADNDKIHGSWILSGLLRKKELSQSVGVINEEEHIEDSLTKAASQLSIDEHAEVKVPKKKAKPSELREMNFWSPTSM